MHPPGADRLSELVFEDVIHRPDDEVHALDRRVDDAEHFGGARKRAPEELVVEFDDQVLARLQAG